MANHADGSIIIDTELNPEGFKKGSDGLAKALKSLSSKMDSLGPTFDKALKGNARAIQTFEGKVKSLETTIGDLEKKMEALGETRVPTDEYKWLTAEIEKARKKLIDLEEKQIKFEATGVKKSSQRWKDLQYDIELAKRKLKDYEVDQAYMEKSGTAFVPEVGLTEYSKLEAALAILKNRLAEMRIGAEQAKTGFAGLRVALRSAAPLSEQFKQALIGIPRIASQIRASLKNAGISIKYVFTHPIKSINQLLGSTRAGIRYLGKETLKHIGSTCKNAFKSASKSILSFRKHTNGASKSASKFGGSLNQIKRMLGQMLIFRAFTAVLTSAKEGLDNLSKYSAKTNSDLSAFKSSLTQLKNSFATAFAPILSVVTPILTTLINHLSTAVTYVGKLVAALTGAKSFTKATAVQEDYAASLDKTAKSAEEAERQLMGFDKINKLDDKSSNSNSGSGNANVSEMFEEVPIESNIADFAEQLKTAIENSDYEGVGELLAEKLNSVVDKINDAISWENVEPKATAFVNGFTGTFNSLVDNVDWTLIGDTVGEGINTVVNTVHLLVTGIDWKDIGTAFSDGINGFISTVDWGNIGDTISDGVKGIIGTLRASIADMDWQNVGGAVSSALNNIDWVGIVSSVVGSVSDALKGAFDLAIGFVKDLDWTKLGADLWNSLVAVITNIDWLGLVTKAFDLLGKVIKGAINLFTGIATAIVDSLKTAWSSILSLVQEFANGGGGDIIEGLKQGIIDALKSIGAWLYENIFLPIWEGIKSVFGINSPSTKMMEIGRFLIEGLLAGLGNIWSKVKEKFTTFYTKLKDWFLGAKENVLKIGGWVTSWLKSGIGNIWTSIKEKFTTFYSNLKNWFTNLKVSSLGSTLISNIKNGIGNIWKNLKTKFTTFWTDMKNWFAGRALKLKTTWDTTSTLGKALVNMGLKGMPKLSFFAKGGIVDGATLSVLGEAGKEAVIPLERNTGWMKVMAQAIASEIASDSFGVQQIEISYDFDETLVSGIRSVSYEFLERLQAIASSVTFTMPVAAQQSVPYAVAAYVEGSPDIGTIIETSNDELAVAVTRAIAAATASIVEAIEKQGSNDGLTDTANVTSKVIQEINRIKRVTGKSPINS